MLLSIICQDQWRCKGGGNLGDSLAALSGERHLVDLNVIFNGF